MKVGLLQFAEYTIFFGEASINNVVTVKAIMRYFELASCLKVNFSKSCFGGVGLELEEKERMTEILNYRLMNIPFVYLRVPIGANSCLVST